MSIIDDLKTGVENYTKTNVDVVIEGPAQAPPEGKAFPYFIVVKNTGHLNMRGVKLTVAGTKWAKPMQVPIAGPLPSLTLGTYTVDAHATKKFGPFLAMAIEDTNGVAQVVLSACVSSWDADLSHILNAHSVQGPYEGQLKTQILP